MDRGALQKLKRLQVCEALAAGLVLCALAVGAAEGGIIDYAVKPRHVRSSSLCAIYCRRAADDGGGSEGGYGGRLVHLCFCAPPQPDAHSATQRGPRGSGELRLGSSFARKNPLMRWG